MSGCGMNSSGANPIGSSRGPNRVQEQCVICHRAFSNTEALINHYDVHIRGSDELMNFHNNNNVRAQNQAAAAAAAPQAQRRLTFALPPSFSAPAVPPVAIRTTHTVIQARPIQPVGAGGPVRRRQNFAPRVNMARPAARPRAAQRNQPPPAAAAAAVPVPDVIDLDFGEEGNYNNTGGGINLDLTLGR